MSNFDYNQQQYGGQYQQYGGNAPYNQPPAGYNQGAPQGHPQQQQPQPQQPNTIFQGVSPEMLNFGLNAGQDMLSKQKEKWMPGVSGFWFSLKFYFSVSNSYVVKKLKIIMYPLNNKVWTRILADEFQTDEADQQYSRKWALPKQDTNSPDLYIPLMSFVTYVLLCGIVTGLNSHGRVFTPEVLVQTIWRCLLLQLAESAIIKVGVSVLSVSLPFLDVFAYTGYKYVGLCAGVVAQLLGNTISTLVSLYTCGMLGYFILRTLAGVVPTSPASTGGGPPRHLVLLGFAVMQFIVAFTLSFL